MVWKKHKKLFLILAAVVVVLAIAVPLTVLAVSRAFTAQESAVRTDWGDADVGGEVVERDEALQIEYAEVDLNGGLRVLQLVPMDLEEENFTYYDAGVQQRLSDALEELKAGDVQWTASNPLAVLNPYGTGSNGLYLYFETDLPTQVSYTVHVEDDSIPDYTATAADAGGETYTRVHEFQLIGLVPGETNEVTMQVTGSWGTVRQTVTFTVDMPETQSGYDTTLETTDGTSDAALTEGLFAMMRVNGYLGYGFFYDNAGVLRYEMVLEGYGLDRILPYGDDIITCVSSTRLARINGLGQVEQVYDLDGYELHHDIGFGQEGELLALAEHVDGETVEDVVLSVDLETGEVSELIDFTDVLPEYFETTHAVAPTDEFFWQAGEWDWLHLNSLQYMPEDDALIVSSRETSTIIKVTGIHSEVTLDWMAGDEAFWADTAYAEYSLRQEGDFVPQYGQHFVEYLGDGETEGVYYLAVYNNNYWANSSRDGYEPELAESVGTDLYGDGSETSQVYVYCIDENERAFSLVSSFDVPYSSIVSNASHYGEEGHWVVNSGVAMVFGEYDADGVLIREYAYECTMQNYRTIKYDMVGCWFAE
ncbi:MAG TPA: aryl-sulfate sulfotransferase [Candidatus Onthomonas avicola]|nr:aryl-sulfate sulfotransferase [Candidatus Onthomonas avicola]